MKQGEQAGLRSTRRRRLLQGLAGLMGAVWGPLPGTVRAVEPQAVVRPARPLRVAMVLWRGETEVEQGFRERIAEAGLPLRIEVHDLARDLSALPGVLARLRADPPELVYTWGTGVTLGVAGRHEESLAGLAGLAGLDGVPVVFVMVAAPVDTGLIPADGRSRRNLTGVSHIAPLEAQIAAIRAYLPMRRLGVVYNFAEPASRASLSALKALGAQLGFEVEAWALGEDGPARVEDIAPAVAELAGRGVEVLYIGPDNFIGNHRDVLTEAGFRHRLPAFTATALEVRDGQALFGLVSRYELVGRLAAEKALQILRDGRSPEDIPIETLDRFAYLIRLSAAHRLGLYPPLPLLDYAEVIE